MLNPLMEHQKEALKLSRRRRGYGFFCEQGTGKTVILLAEAEHFYNKGTINGLLVIAPKGVHTNWVRREIPKHLECEHTAVAYKTGLKTVAKAIDLMNDHGKGLHILAINIDAVNTKKGFACVQEFLAKHKAMIVVDESHRIKTPGAKRTQKVLRLAKSAVVRRIATGTPLTNAPPDLFTQFEFIAPEQNLLGTDSYRAFVAEYAELQPPTSNLVRHIEATRRRPGPPPQIVATDAQGRPRWRNLDKLRGLLAPHCFRITKAECLDLPDKIYRNHYFDLPTPLRATYNQMETELFIEFDGDILTATALAALTKTQQITSGFVLVAGTPVYLDAEPHNNARLAALKELLPDIQGQFIVWARFKEELRAIVAMLAEENIGVVEYHGDISATQRELAVDEFQNGKARAFVGQPQAGGLGLTLTAANVAIYYSNDFNLGTRLQSEDRCHRIGTKRSVLYIDLVASDTIDERIADALQRKAEVAAEILDRR